MQDMSSNGASEKDSQMAKLKKVITGKFLLNRFEVVCALDKFSNFS